MIPSCAGLGRLAVTSGAAERARARLGLERRSIMVYVGKLTEPDMDREMVEFFWVARRSDPALAFLVLTQASPASILSELARVGIPETDYRITRCEPDEMGEYLGMADFARCFCRPSFARIASFPTKVGEYLAAGLQLVSGAGIGDLDRFLDREEVGVVVEQLDGRSYERCARRIRELASDPACLARCREVAGEAFSLQAVGIPRYDRLYRRLALAGGGDRAATG